MTETQWAILISDLNRFEKSFEWISPKKKSVKKDTKDKEEV
jgi:hypothetical protein